MTVASRPLRGTSPSFSQEPNMHGDFALYAQGSSERRLLAVPKPVPTAARRAKVSTVSTTR